MNADLQPPRVHYGAVSAAGAVGAATDVQPVAVLVCHGMGQQVRYETISSIASAVLTEAWSNGGVANPLDVHLVQQDQGILTRAEISWKDGAGVPHAAHVYEAYWAPLTEGRVTYRDTIRFLLQAAWNGLKWSRPFKATTFRRWMFGQPQPLTIGGRTFVALIAALAILLAQVVVIGAVSLKLASLLALFYGAVRTRTFALPATAREMIHGALWILLVIEVLAARYFLIQFVGDVAAYVSPYKDSKFDELRQKIQKVGLDVGKVIYGFGGPLTGVPDYQRVVVVGHSLGSVLAYDTLNALINLDNVSSAAGKRDVVTRTRALITFGSPLDKTAFIFRMQPKNKQDWMREHLAASTQPLILSYGDYRKDTFRWTNLWSPKDVISGSLEYYDAVPESDAKHVRNIKDPQASVPLLAHTQYWNGQLLRKVLHDAIV